MKLHVWDGDAPRCREPDASKIPRVGYEVLSTDRVGFIEMEMCDRCVAAIIFDHLGADPRS